MAASLISATGSRIRLNPVAVPSERTYTGLWCQTGNVPFRNVRRSIDGTCVGSLYERLADDADSEFFSAKNVLSAVFGPCSAQCK
jgi:hypothetical protein